MNPYIITRYGHRVHFLKPKPSEIDIRDIAHALSRIVRFGGHTKVPYHVAQHVCLCCDIAPMEYKKEALMHDAAESFVGDCTAPLKRLLPQFAEVESRVERTVARKFGYRFPYPAAVKDVDMRLLVTEIRDLTNRTDWRDLPFVPLDDPIEVWDGDRARREFMKRFRQLFS